MVKTVQAYKGNHPGAVLEQLLQERGIRKRHLAHELDEHPQTISSITKGVRSMNTALSIKIESFLGLEEGFFMILQVYYDIRKAKEKQSEKALPSSLRRVLFWDTDMEKIDWRRQYRSVIMRVFERGNEQEKEVIVHFYGQAVVDEVLSQ
jgi:addiction module HigA family antidote